MHHSREQRHSVHTPLTLAPVDEAPPLRPRSLFANHNSSVQTQNPAPFVLPSLILHACCTSPKRNNPPLQTHQPIFVDQGNCFCIPWMDQTFNSDPFLPKFSFPLLQDQSFQVEGPAHTPHKDRISSRETPEFIHEEGHTPDY